jgi:uncharacterized protein
VLGTPSPAVTPTNLLYNVVATPGALYRCWRQGQTGGRLALVLIAGTLPGVIAGSIIRVELLPSARVFDFVAAVLLPLGIWLALTVPPSADGESGPARAIPPPTLTLSVHHHGSAPPTGRPASRWASAAWQARTPAPASSTGSPTRSSAE